MMQLRVLAFLMLALAMLALPPARGGTAAAGQRALVLEIDGVIGPPLADYIGRELRAARPDEVGIVVLRMNTPGGLDASMRQIVSAILASPVPVGDLCRPERRTRGERRHLYRLCKRDRGDGPGHQYRRRHADPARRPSDGASRSGAAKGESG